MSESPVNQNLEDNLPMVNYIMLHRIYDMLTLIAILRTIVRLITLSPFRLMWFAVETQKLKSVRLLVLAQ